MRRGTADHGTQADNPVILSAVGHFLGGQRNLKGARYSGDVYVLVVAAMADNGVDGPFQQALADKAVETTNYDADFLAFRVQFSFKEQWHGYPPSGGVKK